MMSKRSELSVQSENEGHRIVAPLEPELQEIFGPPPLYEGESEESYNHLHDRVRSAVLPEDVIEEIWVRDIVDLFWETLRLRRLKAKLMDAASSKGLERVLATLETDYFARDQLVKGWANGRADARKQVNQLLKKAGHDKAIIEAQTLAARLDDFERIDRLIMQSEARRNAVLREVDRHRDAVARRLGDAVADIKDAEYEEVSAPDAIARP
jgi:hypothetical protein